MLIVVSPSCLLLLFSNSLVAPVNALISIQQIRSSSRFSPALLADAGNTFKKQGAHVCTTFATTTFTTITEEEVDQKSLQVTQRDLYQKKRERSENPDINGSKAWELRLYNDETNFEFWVAEQLVKIVGLSEREAFDTMKLAGISGQAKIGSYECLELAEYYHTALQAEGLAVKLLPIDLC